MEVGQVDMGGRQGQLDMDFGNPKQTSLYFAYRVNIFCYNYCHLEVDNHQNCE